MSYNIEMYLGGREEPKTLRYDTQKECMAQWDKTCDNALSGDRVVLKWKGLIVSEYTPRS